MVYRVAGHNFSIESSVEVLHLLPNFSVFEVQDIRESMLFALRVHITDSLDVTATGYDLLHTDAQDVDMPRLEIYRREGEWLLLTAMYQTSDICARLVTNADFSQADLFVTREVVSFAINNATMLLFAFTALHYRTLELHASVVVRGENGFLFLGKSGTGKSTHSRMWLEAFEDAWLLNDDNPVVRIEDDGVWVYGSPWSGKTPCYKNERRRVGAFVQLRQAPENSIEQARPSKAYINIYGSCSGLKFMESVRDELYEVVAEIVGKVQVWELDCLPNHDAAYLCCESVSIKST
ncbi:MAG: hypothetical protein IJQ95_07610 [Paludibacteraceae bacterium]|nr:hypothetical protein [Paludibacteraceae bacterium]